MYNYIFTVYILWKYFPIIKYTYQSIEYIKITKDIIQSVTKDKTVYKNDSEDWVLLEPECPFVIIEKI